MKTNSILIVENSLRTLQVIRDTFDNGQLSYQICSVTTDGWNQFLTNPQFTGALIRMSADGIDGCELCHRIREVRSEDQFPILMIVGEDFLEHAGSALQAGATDVIIDPFEARELRMWSTLFPPAQGRRVDEPHVHAIPQTAETPVRVTCHEAIGESQRTPSLVVPNFDPASLRFTYGVSQGQLAAWRSDETVAKVALDKVLVCPCCAGLPTFRHGCGTCGSAWTQPEVLIHHYACAYIGPESAFRKGHDLICPKCRQLGLVAGSDFETVAGGNVCHDCGASSSQAELIGHCLSCEHRFPAAEAVSLELSGFHVSRVHEVATAEADGRAKMQPSRQRRSQRQKTGTP